MTVDDAARLLVQLGTSPWLVRHHELVVEAAVVLCDRLVRDLAVTFRRDEVLLGAALHDVGKIVHPEEMSAPGHLHEQAGRQLLLDHGVSESIARFCVTHAAWDDAVELEDLLVALADKLWKGKRVPDLEARVQESIAESSGVEPWSVFDRFDSLCEAIALEGDDRLARSNA